MAGMYCSPFEGEMNQEEEEEELHQRLKRNYDDLVSNNDEDRFELVK